MPERCLCIHAHFYQPPRENPWLEAVELQESAYPYHDWNERVTAECYAPNSASRILDAHGRIARIVNTYSRISFNFGPTLLSWMESNARQVYAAIMEADRASRERFSGHGSAIAQVYNHMILPLANRRDKQTQVLWGIRDFEHRFGRMPEGMWLAETAVDTETLEVLAEAGIRFTILAPHQAARVRPLNELPDAEWQDVSRGQIDPTMVYLQRLPSGRAINLFFYDGPISRAVAFERLLNNGETFAERLLGGFSDERERAQLMHIATDGETYGHHKAHGDMALAYALHHIESNGLAQLTNYGEFLEKFPPTHEVQIAENTSWSCAHGVERWRSDCGCNSGGHTGWNQAWRGPLREALDWLRDTTAPLFGRAASELLCDPSAARDDYIQVLLERAPEVISSFLERHANHRLDAQERTRALMLLEMERHAMLMYTSCGWFFDELSGIETVQVLQYAGRVAQLAQQLFGDHVEEEFLRRLENVHGNLPERGNGRQLYEKWVQPAAITLEDVAAHYAIASLFQRHAETVPTYCYSVARLDYHLSQAGRARLGIGQALVTSRITEESLCTTFATLHFGDHNLVAGVRPDCERQEYNALIPEAGATFENSDLPGAVRLLDRAFPGPHYSLKSLFRDEQRRIVESLIRGILGEAESSYRHIYDQHAPLMRFLADLGLPLPMVLEVSAEHVVNSALRREFAEDPDLAHVRTLLEAARQERVTLHAAELGYVLRKTLDRNFTRLQEAPGDLALLSRLTSMVEMARSLPFEVSLWKAQNIFYQLLQSVYPTLREAQEEEARAWTAEFERLGELLLFSTSAVELPAAA
jgi:alpha-amylase/alpha-mannosidase (GH57 family)